MSVGPGINKPEVERDLQKLSGLIHDGGLPSVTDAELTRLLHTLCIAHTGDSTNALHIVQGLAINHEQMARHITKLNTANGRTQHLVIALTVASLIAAAVQVVCDVRSDLREMRPSRFLPDVSADSNPHLSGETQHHARPGNVKSDGTVSKPIPPPANE